ncbi:Glycine/D-amino acid oxidase [Ruegeria halocynthiae]|uniref:Glycine/D-amino acid oxidase n=1 Tax=Ruegeria halocynthiae TaxID=985054 RepID=A0A1H2YGS0_9RHOB|nr:FAD-dependent oxidoreductase [Ruegeria halocynthiae]SDX04038.1 Glycine/D-amino acid oxidase [Ruegeria halocynthiae]
MRLFEDMAYGSAPIEDSYWTTTVQRPDYPALTGAAKCDTAIIGAGFTGLNAALELARSGQDVVILEAEQPGWGASGRNGGFCCIGGSKTGLADLSRRFGQDHALNYMRAERDAVGFVQARLDDYGIEADTHSKGETRLAHSQNVADEMQDEIAGYRDVYGAEPEFLPREALEDHGLFSAEFYGALTAPIGFALNPMKYATGLAREAADAGVRIHGGSAVTEIAQSGDGQHLLKTAHGELRAKNLIVATNGYSSENLPAWLGGRYMPVQSGIIATRPMTDNELKAQGFTSRQMCYDSRNLLHYFRLLPDNRMLFGLRAASRTTEHSEAETKARARADFDRMFPAWQHVETAHYWSGLVCLSRNLTPFAGPIPGMDRAWAALCYHGNGVAMGSYTGAMIAGQILNQGPQTPHVMTGPMRRFELGRWRRAMLPLIYAWYGLQDRRA